MSKTKRCPCCKRKIKTGINNIKFKEHVKLCDNNGGMRRKKGEKKRC